MRVTAGMDRTAIERCAYCRRYVPVTWVEVTEDDAPLSAQIAVCEECRNDGR